MFEGDRVALVGPNGAGKSTLLHLLAGLEPPDAGTLARRRLLRVAHVAQAPELPGDALPEEIVAAALAADGLADHECGSRAAVALGRAGFTGPPRTVRELSGGWRKRLALAAQLAREPDLLLLDEPTNHLDLEGVLWLEETLLHDAPACVVVSHDRYLLQAVATRVLELDRRWPGGLFATDGSFADFLERREAARAGQQAREATLANLVRREVEWLRRGPKARTTKSQARIQSAGRLQAELGDLERRNATSTAGVEFADSGRRSKRLLVAEAVGIARGGRTLVAGLDLTLGPGTRVGLLGPNGSGKTTLLRVLAREIPPEAGSVWHAPELRVARFEQGRESLDPASSLKAALAPEGDAVTVDGQQVHVSAWARRFLFRPEQLELPVSRLSGGEQARVILARLVLRPADLLLMDEPTNDLDIDTLGVLEDALASFPGALVLVTHDRLLLDRVATTLLALEGDGRVTAYADLAQWQASVRPPAAARPAPATAKPDRQRPKQVRLTWSETREWEAMEGRILEAEDELRRRREAASETAISSDARLLQERHESLAAAEAEVARLYARWAELEAKGEAAGRPREAE